MKISVVNKNHWVSFVLTLTATLVGVFIAIWLTNIGTRKKEKTDTVKLLHTAQIIVENAKSYSSTLKKTILDLEKDTMYNHTEKIREIKKANPIPYPDLLETILTNELISKNISLYSHNEIYNSLINLRKLAHYETADYYEAYLSKLIVLLDYEIAYQDGEINQQELQLLVEKENAGDLPESNNVLKVYSN